MKYSQACRWSFKELYEWITELVLMLVKGICRVYEIVRSWELGSIDQGSSDRRRIFVQHVGRIISRFEKKNFFNVAHNFQSIFWSLKKTGSRTHRRFPPWCYIHYAFLISSRNLKLKQLSHCIEVRSWMKEFPTYQPVRGFPDCPKLWQELQNARHWGRKLVLSSTPGKKETYICHVQHPKTER
jgi:hypothetical protein